MPNTSTNEHANMHFVHDFCNGNGRAAVVEEWKHYPQWETFESVYRILMENGSFP